MTALAAAVAHRTSPIKRARRGRADIAAIREAIVRTLGSDHPMTVRQVFYQLVSAGVVAKSEAEYKGTVCRLLAEMRRGGEIPFGWIADSTRWMRKPKTYRSMEHALQATARTYRRSVWADLDVYVEVWLEKDALAGVLVEETATWDVPLMVTRGYPSLSYLYEAADYISDTDKPTFLYYFGDHDPSGLDIPRTVERGIRDMAPDVELHFKRIAVTREQIEEYDLPTRPTKKTDSRSKTFEGESVEVDAIPSSVLRSLVRGCIERHVSREELTRLLAIEDAERETLMEIAKRGLAPKRRARR